MENTIQLIVADRNDLWRRGFCQLAGAEQQLSISGEARSLEEAIVLCETLLPGEQLLLLDDLLLGSESWDLLRVLRSRRAQLPIVLLTEAYSPAAFVRAVRGGAAGYLVKSTPFAQMVRALRQVVEGKGWWDGLQAVDVIGRLVTDPSFYARMVTPQLTQREQDVLALLVRGLTNGEIGQALGVSTSTVKVHVEHIIHKFGARDRTQAAVRAVELGLVP